MGLKITGADEFNRKLENFAKKAKQESGTKEVKFDDLFVPSFMSENTKSSTIEDFLGDLNVKNADEFKALPQASLEEKVKSDTKFSSWQEMQEAAAADYYARRLGLK